MSEFRAALQGLLTWVDQQEFKYRLPDHACRDCIVGDMNLDGFRCHYHAAKALLARPEPELAPCWVHPAPDAAAPMSPGKMFTAVATYAGMPAVRPEPYGKPCTCDNALGGSCLCYVEAGGKLGQLWYCRKAAEAAERLTAATARPDPSIRVDEYFPWELQHRAAEQSRQAQPVAWVPLHPRLGPLWASTIGSLDSDHPKNYALMPLYASVPVPPVASNGDVSCKARELEAELDKLRAEKRAADDLVAQKDREIRRLAALINNQLIERFAASISKSVVESVCASTDTRAGMAS